MTTNLWQWHRENMQKPLKGASNLARVRRDLSARWKKTGIAPYVGESETNKKHGEYGASKTRAGLGS